jgi:hypothetical protein
VLADPAALAGAATGEPGLGDAAPDGDEALAGVAG